MKKSLTETTNGTIQAEQSASPFQIPLVRVVRKLREYRFAKDYESQLVILFRKQDFPFHRIVLPNRGYISPELLSRYIRLLNLPEELMNVGMSLPEKGKTERSD